MTAQKQTTWETPVPEPKAWALSAKLLAGLGGLILMLLTTVGGLVLLGFQAQNQKIEAGDKAIFESIKLGHDQMCASLKDLKEQNLTFNTIQIELLKDVAALKANQKIRLDRELMEYDFRHRNGRGGK